ncbi:MAG: GTP-binding protein [Nocardioides sp.]
MHSNSGQSAAPSATAKVVIAGGAGAGVTTFVEAVSEVAPIFRGSVPLTVDYGRTNVDRSLRLYLFGLPSARFAFAWPGLLRGALGAVVLADARDIAASFSVIDFFESRRIPFLVVVNVFDDNTRPEPAAIRVALALDKDVPVLVTDVRIAHAVKSALVELLDVVLFRALAN